MKRLLIEILCAMAVLVFLASLHSRISSLKESSKEVSELRETVRSTVARLESRQNLEGERRQIVQAFEAKIANLEKRVAQATFNSDETNALKAELGETRRESALFKAQLEEDISRTKQIVDAYQAEMRTVRNSNSQSLQQARSDIALLANHLNRDPNALTEELLAPAVQLNGSDTVGSGTLIYSGKRDEKGKCESYVITSYHVVRNILADTPSAKRQGIAVTIYHSDRKEELRCDIVSKDTRIDAALLKLRTTKEFKNLARVIPEADEANIRVWDRIYAVGCPLGNDPIPSEGQVSSLRNELNGTNYWMINAPTYFGNSGGAVYLADTRELAGVFSKIYTHGRGNPVVIPHMGLFTPMPAIRKWLRKDKYDFVLTNETQPKRRAMPSIQHLAAPAPR